MLLEKLKGYAGMHSEWDSRVSELRSRCDCGFDYDAHPIPPQRVMKEINSVLDEDVIVTTDVGQNQMWAMHCLRIDHPRHMLTSGSFGTMGFGLPSAMGAKVARPD